MEADSKSRVKSKKKNRNMGQHDTKNILRYNALHDIINLNEFKDQNKRLNTKR